MAVLRTPGSVPAWGYYRSEVGTDGRWHEARGGQIVINYGPRRGWLRQRYTVLP